MSFDVLHIVASLDPAHGGPSQSVLALACAQAAAGARVCLAALDYRPRSIPPGGITLQIATGNAPRLLACSRELNAFLQSTPAAVIHHHGLWLRTLHYAHAAARRHGSTLIIAPRGMLEPWARNHHALRKKLASRFVHPGAIEAAAGWHATSQAEAVNFSDISGGASVCVAPNGIHAPTTNALDQARRAWLAACPVLAGKRVALFYGRFHPKKRVRELIQLWATKARPGWTLLIAGIPEHYTIETLRDYAGKIGAQHSVCIENGLNRPPPYAIASLFVLPTHSENFGQTIVESLAARVPVLVTDTTPWHALNHERSGWCVSWDDFPAALDRTLALPPDALTETGDRGHSYSITNYSWTATARRLLDFYPTLSKQSPALLAQTA
ncbi:glycosyltransferase [Geminisphaera colitermitum]|uniref:glycosyltransferase n=1 Tax=Geminisphaera colitermitum TaxID=1148786 RepID=UPI0001965373|nr:glycosyltransferase [Geminisphaera colitermitum]